MNLRPDQTHVVFYRNGNETDPTVITAHVDPDHPEAWRSDPVHRDIQRLIANGATVKVEIGPVTITLRPT